MKVFRVEFICYVRRIVKDIRMYIESHLSGSSYDLMMTYPRKVLSDPSATIEKAGLISSVIIQTLR